MDLERARARSTLRRRPTSSQVAPTGCDWDVQLILLVLGRTQELRARLSARATRGDVERARRPDPAGLVLCPGLARARPGEVAGGSPRRPSRCSRCAAERPTWPPGRLVPGRVLRRRVRATAARTTAGAGASTRRCAARAAAEHRRRRGSVSSPRSRTSSRSGGPARRRLGTPARGAPRRVPCRGAAGRRAGGRARDGAKRGVPLDVTIPLAPRRGLVRGGHARIDRARPLQPLNSRRYPTNPARRFWGQRGAAARARFLLNLFFLSTKPVDVASSDLDDTNRPCLLPDPTPRRRSLL